jgi:signal transduction histidine kinase
MRRAVFIFQFIFFQAVLFSQVNVSDSFKVLLQRSVPDSIMIDKINQYIIRFSPNDPVVSLRYADSAISMSLKISDSARLAFSHNRKGVANFYLGDYSNSLENYFEALSIKRKSGDTLSIWREYNNIGLVLRNLEQNEEALQYFNLAKKLIEKAGEKAFVPTLWNNIGISYRGLRKNKEAEEALEKSLAMNNELGAEQSKALNLNNLGNIHTDLKEYDEAVRYYNEALEINRRIQNRFEEIQGLNNLSRLYFRMGDYKQAKSFIDQAELLLKDYKSNQLELNWLVMSADYFTAIKDYRNAHYFRNSALVMKDSLFYGRQNEKFTQLKTLANTEKEAQKVSFLSRINAIQKKQIRIQKIIQFGGALVLVFILFFLFYVLRSLKIKKNLAKKLAERADEIETLNEELQSTVEELNTKTENLEKLLIDFKAAQVQLIQSEKLASLGTLASGVAHEINNPLNFIAGGTIFIDDYLKEKLPGGYDEAKPVIDAIRTGIERATKIVRSLNQYNSRDDLPFTNCNIHSILDDCLIILNSEFTEKIEIIRNYSTGPGILEGNEGKLHQVFLNILGNAVHAITGKGSIKVTTEVDGRYLKVSVKDTGIGIPESNLSKITDPFFTTKGPGKGTGLGLAIAYTIIKEHKGILEFQSQPGAGTTVTVKLPM